MKELKEILLAAKEEKDTEENAQTEQSTNALLWTEKNLLLATSLIVQRSLENGKMMDSVRCWGKRTVEREFRNNLGRA